MSATRPHPGVSRRPSWTRFARRSVRQSAARAGTVLLRSAALRNLLNDAYERGGPRFRRWFDRLFSASRIPCSFEWRCSFGGREFRMPVIPEVQRSWNAALVWRWVGNASIRRLYELYLRTTPPGTFIDVGANDGTHTYPFALHGYRCVAIEPQPTCIEYMRRVCALNAFHGVTVIQAMVTDEPVASAVLFVSESTWYSSRIRSSTERFEPSEAITVPCVSLDSIGEGLVAPTLIKIDVEGWEWQVVKSGGALLRRYRPDLLIEVAVDNAGRREMWDTLAGLGYGCVLLQPYAPRRVMSCEDFLCAPEGLSHDYLFSTRGELLTLLTDAQYPA